MISYYENSIDLYIESAKTFNPNYTEEQLYGFARGLFKMILLGLLYGMGVNKAMEMTGLSKEECQRAREVMLGKFPKVQEMIARKSQYPLDHNHRIDTQLGDILISYGDKAEHIRHGINYYVQNFTSVILVQGFMNLIKQSDKLGMGVQPIIYVHDSSINYFPVRNFWDINNFYVKHFTEYLYDLVGVRYLFKTLVGPNYWDMGTLTHESENVTSIKGSATTILGIAQKLDEGGMKYETDIPLSEVKVKWKNSRRCILDYSEDPWMGIDESKYSVKFTKLC